MAEMYGGVCPFYRTERKCPPKAKDPPDADRWRIHCEAAIIKCPDRVFRRAVVYRYCGHPENWKKCQLYNLLSDYYDKKETNHE